MSCLGCWRSGEKGNSRAGVVRSRLRSFLSREHVHAWVWDLASRLLLLAYFSLSLMCLVPRSRPSHLSTCALSRITSMQVSGSTNGRASPVTVPTTTPPTQPISSPFIVRFAFIPSPFPSFSPRLCPPPTRMQRMCACACVSLPGPVHFEPHVPLKPPHATDVPISLPALPRPASTTPAPPRRALAGSHSHLGAPQLLGQLDDMLPTGLRQLAPADPHLSCMCIQEWGRPSIHHAFPLPLLLAPVGRLVTLP